MVELAEILKFMEIINKDLSKNQNFEMNESKLKVINDNRNTVSYPQYFLDIYEESSPFVSNLMKTTNISLPEKIKEKIKLLTTELNFNDNIKYEIENFTLKLYIHDGRQNIEISQSSEGEMLIYTEKNGAYKNAIFDSDGDIEILKIPIDKRQTQNKIFFREDNHNLSTIFKTFNAM